ncbi:MAG: hypothetical protein K1X94_35380 [Sandaracinaceae bacterium]|nr:hypothetical protein [Sandaracinaceae bacterium]
MRALAAIGLVSLGLAGCGGGAYPRALLSTVHRTEEQGIDFSSTGTWSLEVQLDEGGHGLATLTTRATDVMGSDAHTEDSVVTYDATARREGEGLALALVPRAGAPPTAHAVSLSCAPWTETERALESFEPLPSAGGVAWACALPSDDRFALGRVALEHVPREGRAFVLFSETHPIVIDEDVTQGGRTVRLRPAAAPR